MMRFLPQYGLGAICAAVQSRTTIKNAVSDALIFTQPLGLTSCSAYHKTRLDVMKTDRLHHDLLNTEST